MKAIHKQIEFNETQEEASRTSKNCPQFPGKYCLTQVQGYSCLCAVSSQTLCSDFPNYTFHLILREQTETSLSSLRHHYMDRYILK